MGDYEIHRLEIRPTDDVASILNNITSNTEVILREGATYTMAAQVTFTGLSNVVIRVSKSSLLSISYAAGSPFVITGGSSAIRFEGFRVDFSPASGSFSLFDLIGASSHDYFTITDMQMSFDAASGDNKVVGRSSSTGADLEGMEISNNRFDGAALSSILDANLNARIQRSIIRNNFWERDSIGGDCVIDLSGITSSFFNLGNRIIENTVIACTEFFKNPTTVGGSSYEEYIVGNKILDSGSGAGDTCVYIGGGRDRGAFFANNQISNYTGDYMLFLTSNQAAASTKPQVVNNQFYDLNTGTECINAHFASGGIIANNDFSDFGTYAIRTRAGWGGAPGYGLIIANNTFYGGTTVFRDFDTSGAHSDCVLSGNTALEQSGDAFNGNQCDRWSITGNVVRNCGGAAFTGWTFSSFEGNTIENPGGRGINSGTHCSVTGNNIRSPADDGIRVTGDGCSVTGNVVYDVPTESGIYGIEINAQNTSCGDNYTEGGYHGIYVGGANRVQIVGNTVRDTGNHGIYNSSGDSLIDGNHVINAGADGIRNNNPYNVLSNNMVDGAAAYGIWLGHSYTSCVGNTLNNVASAGIQCNNREHVTVQGNTIHTVSAGPGIRIFNCDYVKVIDNNIDTTSADGIDMDGSSDVDRDTHITVNGNTVRNAGASGIDFRYIDDFTISDNDVSDSTGDGIEIDDSDYGLVADNLTTANTGYGVEEAATCDNILYNGNRSYTNTAGSKNLLGTNRRQSGNYWP